MSSRALAHAVTHLDYSSDSSLETPASELLCLEWPQPPRNILLVKKYCAEDATDALSEFSRSAFRTERVCVVLLT